MRDAWWYPLALPRRARSADVLHCPSFRGPVRSRVPLVVTVHDLAVLRRPDAFNRWTGTYSRVFVPRVVRAAERVIAVSQFTKRELIELLGVAEDRVRVVPNGVGEPFVPDGERAHGDYVLAVGNGRAAQEPAAARRGDPGARASSSASPARAAGVTCA